MRTKPNAQHGDEPKSSYLHIRVTREQKARWVKQAQAQGMKLSAWVCEKLDDENDVALWKCTKCGKIGAVGRCCGRDTRIPVKYK